MKNKPIYVAFGDKKVESNYEVLKEGKFQDKQLYSFIERAIQDLKNNSMCGIKLPERLWPKVYIQKYEISNLWKYNLPDGWRLIYTIRTDEVMILNVILEWMNHKEYERRLGY